jgi:hypothetical protein
MEHLSFCQARRKPPKTRDAGPKQPIFDPAPNAFRNFYGDVTGYQEATEEGKPKKRDGSVVPGANVSVRFRPRNNDPRDGQEADLKPIA